MNIIEPGDWEYWLRKNDDRTATYRSDSLPANDELSEVMRKGGVTAEKVSHKFGRTEDVYFEIKKSVTFHYNLDRRTFTY